MFNNYTLVKNTYSGVYTVAGTSIKLVKLLGIGDHLDFELKIKLVFVAKTKVCLVSERSRTKIFH